MAKLKGIYRSQRMPSYRGKVMIDVLKGQVRVRKWPTKRGPPKSELQAWWVDWFKQANLLAKYVDGASAARAIDMSMGSGMYPRDILLKAMRGRLYSWEDPSGRIWRSMAAILDISNSLDVLSDAIGSVLVRASDRWRAPSPGAVGDVLTYQGAAAAPSWQPLSAVAGFGGGALVYRSSSFSLPNNTTTNIPFTNSKYDTHSFFDVGANPTRLTIPTGATWARVTADVEIIGSGTGYRRMLLRKNGVSYEGRGFCKIPGGGVSNQELNAVSAVVAVSAGDYFEMGLFQNSGSARNVGTNSWNMSFSVQIW